MNQHGSRTWFFPDGDLPPVGDPTEPMYGHESLVLLNPNEEDAQVTLTVYYEDREPATLSGLAVGGSRVRCVRTNEPIDGYQIPPGQYALRIQSTVPIICQLGRADVRQANLAYYTTMGYSV